MISDSILCALFARPTSSPGNSLFLRILRLFATKQLAAAKGRAMLQQVNLLFFLLDFHIAFP